MKQKILLSILLILIISSGIYVIFNKNKNNIKDIMVGECVFRVEIVDTPDKIKKGLAERNKLCDNCGMLFSFIGKKERPFWMKGMKFPLDIIWLADDKVIWVEKNISHLDQETIWHPPVLANNVLEINAGQAEKCRISAN